MRNFILVLSAMTLFSHLATATEQLFTEQPTVTPALAVDGRWPVGVTTIEIETPDQLNPAGFQTPYARKLTLEVWYPLKKLDSRDAKPASYKDVLRSGAQFDLAGTAYRDHAITPLEEPAPLIVISHGYTGYRTIMFYLAEHLASHGYLVAAIDHTDSTNAEIDFAKNAGAGFPSTLYYRARDQQHTVNALMSDSRFKGVVDPQSSAVIGYSMGGYGALNTVGACYDFTPQRLQGLGFPEPAAAAMSPLFSSCAAGGNAVDTRWKAMVAFAPWGGEQQVHTVESLGKITVPGLFIAGEQDDISGFETGVKRLYQRYGAENKYLMIYENARHNIAGHPAPKAAFDNDLAIGHYFEPAWNSEAITRINEHMTLAFLDCHVRAKPSACEFLPVRETNTQTKQDDGSLTAPWPGFPDRWGTGVRFIRASPATKKLNN